MPIWNLQVLNRHDFPMDAFLHLGVTSRFSCGNLFPIKLREAVLFGEASIGWSRYVQVGSDTDCVTYEISSGRWQPQESTGASVKGGCTIVVPIETDAVSVAELTDEPTVASIAAWLARTRKSACLKDYYDDARQDGIMIDLFEAPAPLNQLYELIDTRQTGRCPRDLNSMRFRRQ